MTYARSVFLALDSLRIAPALISNDPSSNTQLALEIVAFVAIPLTFAAAPAVLAAFAQRRRNGARVGLTIVTVVTLALSVPTGGPELGHFVNAAYVAVVLALFWVPASNAWYRERATA